MKWTRHQLAPAMPGQEIIDRAVAGWVSDGLLIGALEIVDVQHLAGAGGLAKPRQQRLFLSQSHVLALASANRLRLERLDPAPVISHVRAVHRAQRNAHRCRNRRLRHVALAQQHHLDALALRRRDFPAQRGFQFPNLTLGAFDHLGPTNQMITANHTALLPRQQPATSIRRFNQLWKRYKEDNARAGAGSYSVRGARAAREWRRVSFGRKNSLGQAPSPAI